MNHSIEELFQRLRSSGKTAFIPFITAGDPNLATTAALLQQLPQAGADLIEIGFPFSDPIADGPTIQASYTRALNAGIKLDKILETVASVRATVSVPIVAMVSYSLIFRKNPQLFVDQAVRAGINGLIVPDLVADEAGEFAQICAKSGCSLIPLITPTTSPSRAKLIAEIASGFIYYVSVVGITGERTTLPAELSQQLLALKELTTVPLCVGFGISTPQQVEMLKGKADGIIVGSAIVRTIHEGGVEAACQLVGRLTESL
ncbi:MAG: tryptophan synthase subunit alpha [Zavarzinella sp.]